MSEERRTLHDRIAELLKRHEQSRAELADLKARAREQDRKLDVRRKIILGAAVQAHAKLNARFREELRRAVLAAVTRPHDKAVLPEFFAEGAPADAPDSVSPHSLRSRNRALPPKLPGERPSGAAPPIAANPRQDGAVPPEALPESPAAPASPTRPPNGKPLTSGAAPA